MKGSIRKSDVRNAGPMLDNGPHCGICLDIYYG